MRRKAFHLLPHCLTFFTYFEKKKYWVERWKQQMYMWRNRENGETVRQYPGTLAAEGLTEFTIGEAIATT